MASMRDGVSLSYIQDEFEVSRRTAERMRDVVVNLFPGEAVHVETGPDKVKRWSLKTGVPGSISIQDLITVSADEMATLEHAAKRLEADNLNDQAASLRSLGTKVQALLKPNTQRLIEPDLEALIQAEGLAMRPGPKPVVDPDVIEKLRFAIKASLCVQLRYRARSTGELSWQPVRPYGFLYGNRHYLVAYSDNPQADDYRLFSLANIKDVKITDDVFEPDPAFSLREYAEGSFGAFQEEPFEVVWRFDEEVADDVKAFQFHPTQTIEEEDDGSVLVRFRAGGAMEMAWHLFTWGEYVEVVEPGHLRELLDDLKAE